MKAFVFPGQGAQFAGMGKSLYDLDAKAQKLFEEANDILGFNISRIMFQGTEEELKQTKVTQPAIFIHSVINAMVNNEFKPDMTAGHSLGEFSALVTSKVLTFEKGLQLVAVRANAMQKACETQDSTMAAVLGLEDSIVEQVCEKVSGIVVAANYNCPGQLVISGERKAVETACVQLKEKGAKRALVLPVGGAFHSPLMQPAKIELSEAITKAAFSTPTCPIYQNVDGKANTEVEKLKKNLIDQLTSPVRWTQTVNNMIIDGAESFSESGPGKALQGMIKKINRKIPVQSL